MCNILDHRKIKMIRKEPEGNTLFLLWLLMITEAGKCDRGGYLMISDGIPYTEETLSMVTDISLPTVQLGLATFARFGMIDQKDGAIFISNWGRYQSEDKLEARRKKDRDRQRKHRKKVRDKIHAQSEDQKLSRDSHVSRSRDVTQENRQEKNRVEKKTTTEQIRLLLAETPFVKISNLELQGLEERHSANRLLLVADVAAETWRRNREDKHNPGGYLNALCTSLVVPDWYVPFSERKAMAKKSQRRKKIIEAEQTALKVREEEEGAATEALWNSLSDEQREEYLKKVRASLPAAIEPPETVAVLMAKELAGKSTQPYRHD